VLNLKEDTEFNGVHEGREELKKGNRMGSSEGPREQKKYREYLDLQR
jgi:hypothetical protein